MTHACPAQAGLSVTAIRRHGATRARRALLAFPLLLALAACSLNRAAPQAQLFDLGPPPTDIGSGTKAQRHEPLALSFSAAQMLTDTGVIWRVGDSASPHSYATYRWAASPLQLVRQRVADQLGADGPVVLNGVDPTAPLLQVSLMRFEQVYAADGESSMGQVAMQAVLVRNRRVVDALRVTQAAPASAQDAQGGVAALRVATDAAAREIATWVAQRLPAAPSKE